MEIDGSRNGGSHNRIADQLTTLVESYRDGQFAVDDLLSEIEQLLRGYALYPAQPILVLGFALADLMDKTPAEAIELTLRLVSSTTREARALAAAMIMRFSRFQPGLWLDPVQHLVRDQDWEVRDLAAHCFDTPENGDGAIDFHQSYVWQVVQDWIAHEDYLLRRAATQALIGHAVKVAEFRPKVLAMLDPLLDDDLEYVRDSHAAALRRLGRADPALVFDYMEKSLDTPTEAARETFRKVLDHSFADRLPGRKTKILARINGGE
jgi:3-methyladenine DNA glycosylase AlkD